MIKIERAEELFNIAQTQRPRDYPFIEFIRIDKSYNLGHSEIYKYNNMYPLIKYEFKSIDHQILRKETNHLNL